MIKLVMSGMFFCGTILSGPAAEPASLRLSNSPMKDLRQPQLPRSTRDNDTDFDPDHGRSSNHQPPTG